MQRILKQQLALLALLLLLPLTVMAEKKLFTLEDLLPGGTNYASVMGQKRSYWWDGNVLVDASERTKDTEYPNVFTRDHNIFVQMTAEGEPVAITHDGTRQLQYGESVHRNEFGICGGLFLSPQKDMLAFYRMDQSMVTDYPQVNVFGAGEGSTSRIAVADPDAYPMAGETSHKVTIGIVILKDGKTSYTDSDITWLDLGDTTDRYFTNIAWSPDQKSLYLIELNRAQKDASLDVYDTATGKKQRTLYNEHNDKYVEIMNPVSFLPWDASQFLLWSHRDGFMHLYLCDTGKGVLRQLTKGSWEVLRLVGFCTKSRSVIIESNELSPIQCNLFSVKVKTGMRHVLDNGKGWHRGLLSGDGTMLLDSWSEPDVAQAYAKVNTVTGKREELHRNADPWQDYQQPVFRLGTIKAADGKTDLYYRLVLPKGYEEIAKDSSLFTHHSSLPKLPCVVYVYGGPHAHNIDVSWHYGARPWETYMAQKGYAVFILDNRGSENRGKDFEQVTYLRLGQEEMRDQMKGVEFLKSLPYIDKERLGVHGWSFGGFMTISLMTNYPDVFKIGVAGGPVIDWKWYEVMYGERYMGTPQSNPEGYAQTSLLDKAKNLKGRLQIIIGGNDDVVVPQHTMNFINECIKAGKQADLFIYPGVGHNVRGHDAVHLYERITEYFIH